MSLADTAFVPLELPEVLIRPDGGRILPLKGLIGELERMGSRPRSSTPVRGAGSLAEVAY